MIETPLDSLLGFCRLEGSSGRGLISTKSGPVGLQKLEGKTLDQCLILCILAKHSYLCVAVFNYRF